MKITNIPLLLAALADSYDSYLAAAEGSIGRTPAPSGPAQLAAIVRTVLDLHQHRLWKRKVPTQPGAGFVPTDDVGAAEVAECQSCGEIDPELFWCKHVRAMFAAMCDVDAPATDVEAWPDLAEAIHRARDQFEKPIAAAIVRSITNASFTARYRVELAEAVLCSTPTGGADR